VLVLADGRSLQHLILDFVDEFLERIYELEVDVFFKLLHLRVQPFHLLFEFLSIMLEVGLLVEAVAEEVVDLALVLFELLAAQLGRLVQLPRPLHALLFIGFYADEGLEVDLGDDLDGLVAGLLEQVREAHHLLHLPLQAERVQ